MTHGYFSPRPKIPNLFEVSLVYLTDALHKALKIKQVLLLFFVVAKMRIADIDLQKLLCGRGLIVNIAKKD